MMRGLTFIVATCLLALAIAPLAFTTARAQAGLPRLILPVNGQELGPNPVFSPTRILVSQVPIEIVILFHNNDTMVHTFTINDENETIQINTGFVDPGGNATVNFTLLTLTRILYNGTVFTPESDASGVLFYCIPHLAAGMIGHIALATTPPATSEEKGILIRAYWIGIIGIAAMLLWIGISYFVIKSGSRHFKDHREHVRRGLP